MYIYLRFMVLASVSCVIGYSDTGPACESLFLYEPPRAIVGFEQGGASSANPSQNFFGNIFATLPIKTQKTCSDQRRTATYDTPVFRLWGDARLTSVPQQVSASIATFVAGGALSSLQSLKVNEVVRGAEFRGGAEFRLTHFKYLGEADNPPIPNASDGSFLQPYLSLILAGGFSTPFTPLSTLQVYNIPPVGASQRDQFLNQYSIPGSYPYVGFITKDRDRFFKNYGGGLRLTVARLPQKPSSDNGFTSVAPAVIDATFGQDQAATGGVFHGGVFRIDVFAPLGHLVNLVKLTNSQVQTALSPVYLYMTSIIKFSRTEITTPFVLNPASNTLVTNNATLSQVYIVPSDQINRDYYRVGIGVDVATLARLWIGKIKLGS